MALHELETLPRRRLIGGDVTPTLDGHGFLSEEFSATAQRIDSLFDRRAVLLVAPPWSGKTFLASGLHRYLSDAAGDKERSRFAKNVHCTLFEMEGLGAPLEPDWWSGWQAGNGRACWIVDALDEDARGRLKQMHEILKRIEALHSATRKRLLLLMLSRENEVPPDIDKRLRKIYASTDNQDGDFLTLRLAPVDAHIAEEIVEHTKPGSFEKVCSLIKENRLQSVAALPVVLEHMARLPAGTRATPETVWCGVLKDMLRDMRRERNDTSALSPIDERFEATCRIAAVLTFSGRREVDAGLGESDGPPVEDLFPRGGTSEQLRKPARESLCSAVFVRTATGYRFAQFHVQEWFTAFALEGLRLSQLRPMISDDEQNPFKHYQGLLGLLHKISQNADVKSWITKAYGGIPPRSDAAPWTLDDARSALDRLMHICKETRYVSTPGGLSNLAAPGLGDLLAEMLADQSRTFAERELLIDVAQAVRASETAGVAKAIILDQNEDNHLRHSAAYLLHQVGSDEDLVELDAFLKGTSPGNRHLAAMTSVLIESLLRRGLWPLSQAIEYLPERTEHVVDSTAMLGHHIEERMTLDDARDLLRMVDWDATEGSNEARPQQRIQFADAGQSKRNIIAKAIDLLLGQENLSGDDYNLLLPVALNESALYNMNVEGFRLAAAFEKNERARRGLFLEGLSRDPEAKGIRSCAWQQALTQEDLEWLADLCVDRAGDSPGMWDRLLVLSYGSRVSQARRNRIRALVRQAVPDVLANFDRGRKRHMTQEKKWKAREEKSQKERKVEQYSLGEIVKSTLNHPRMDLRQKMLSFGWSCFVEKEFRPNNIHGEWADLDCKVQQEVLDVCAEALQKCDPTPIPRQGPYPGAILYEAAVFVEVLKQSGPYELDGEQIRKWLPAILKARSPADEVALSRCFEVDSVATEDVLFAKMRREMKSDSGSITAGNLPAEFWSERLCEKAVAIVKDRRLNVKARAELLRLLANRSPAQIKTVARGWANLSATEDASRVLMRRAGLDAMLVIDPESAVALLTSRFQEEG